MSQTIIVDRRGTRGRSSPNRQRLLRRIEGQIKQAIPDIIDQNSVQNIGKNGKGIQIPIKGLGEPTLHQDNGLGRHRKIFSGNDRFVPGDQIAKPLGGEGAGDGTGNGASDNPETWEDQFVVELSKEEFREYFFKDLELPCLEERKKNESVDHFRMRHAGYVHVGIPARLNVIRSMRNRLGRRIAIQRIFDNRIEALYERLESEEDENVRQSIKEDIAYAEKRKKCIPFLDDVDLRYDHYVKEPLPIDSAVMFCLMDVSGSMSKEEKDIAKRFYFFLYLMLEANYRQVDIVWIRHHTSAERVDEDTFFNKPETGGTIVSSALELADEIKRKGDDWSPGGYPTKNWNIYFAQASDGDNFYSDMDKSVELLLDIMKYANHYAYVQIRSPGESNLWARYAEVAKRYSKFQMRHINARNEIWKVFRGLFEKRGVSDSLAALKI
jgi:uncharacterized protein